MANIFSSTTFGDVSQGQILEAFALQDVPNLVLSYQWQTSANGLTWTNVAQADQRTFTLQQAQVGMYVRVLASVASDTSHVVNNVNDLPTGAVTLVGTAAEDARLTVQSTISDLDGLGTLHYQWQQSADGVAWTNVNDATQVSLDLKAAQVGQHMRALVSYTDGGGTVESMFSAASTVVAHTNHAPTGGVKVALASDTQNAAATVTASSDVLVASNTLDDKDGMGAVAYQWQKLSKDISGTDVWVDIAQANGATLAPVGMAGQQVRVKASYTDLLGSKEAQTSAAVLVNDAASGNVGMDGDLVQGQVLTANNTLSDLNGLGTVAYTWYQSDAGKAGTWSAIANTTGSSLLLTQAQVGKVLRVDASFTDGTGNRELVASATSTKVTDINDPTTGTLTVSGTLKDGSTLSAVTSGLSDLDGMGTFTYKWQALNGDQWQDLVGKTESTLALTQANVGQTLRLGVVHTDKAGNTAEMFSRAATIENNNDAPTGALETTGTQVAGSQLTVSAANVKDIDGLGTFHYQWQTQSQGGAWSNMDGETAATLSLANNLAASKVRALVNYTDAFGTAEQVVGTASGPIKNINWADHQATGIVSVDGRYAVGQKLAASNAIVDADWLTQVAYQWQVSSSGAGGWKNISGAAQAELTLGTTLQGKYVRVVATTTDELGGHSTVYGDASQKIAKANVAPKFAKSALTLKVNEGVDSVLTPGATDPGDTIAYTLIGADAALFELHAGAIRFKAASDYEKPTDENKDNVYNFTLKATDSYGVSATQDVTVKIANINERPELLQASRTLMVKAGTRYVDDFMGNQVSDQDTYFPFGISKNFAVSGDDAAHFRAQMGRLYLDPGLQKGTYHIEITAKDKGGLNSDLQNVTIEVVDQIQTTATTGNDHLVGTNGADVINGLAGNDTLMGGFGVDTFIVSTGTDTIYDLGYGGQDILQVGAGATALADVTSNWAASTATVNRGLTTLNSTGADIDVSAVQSGNGFTLKAVSGQGHLTGSGLADVLFASDEGNMLRGGAGNDSLHGGAGADQFVIEGLGLDTLLDFQSGKDVIVLTNLGLSAGTLSADAFAKGADLQTASNNAQHLLFDTTSGKLWFDADGSGAQAAVLLAELPTLPNLKNTDFVLI